MQHSGGFVYKTLALAAIFFVISLQRNGAEVGYSCKDKHKDCQEYASQGKCEESEWIKRACHKSCGHIVHDCVNYPVDVCAPDWDDQQRVHFYEQQRMNRRQPGRVPAFTELGYKKLRMPDELYKKFMDTRKWALDRMKKESCQPGLINNCHHGSKNTYLMPIRKDLYNAIERHANIVLEQWIGGKELELTAIYGIRSYQGGHQVHMHVNVVATHVISAILNVAQDVDEDWPLYAIDNHDEIVKINMEPGDMVLYESAKVLHGRPEPIKGRFYDNVFVHFRPKAGWEFSNVPPGDVIPGRDEL